MSFSIQLGVNCMMGVFHHCIGTSFSRLHLGNSVLSCCWVSVVRLVLSVENGRYGHAPIRSDMSIRVYSTADTDTSTPCVGVPATGNIRPGRSLRERSLYAMGGTCRPLATRKLARSVSFMTG